MGKSFSHIIFNFEDNIGSNLVWSVDCDEQKHLAEVDDVSGAITWFDEDAKNSPLVNEAIRAFMRI